MMQAVGAFAEFERATLRERTRAGLEAVRRDGRIGGRRPKLTPQQQAEIVRMVSRGTKTAVSASSRYALKPCRRFSRCGATHIKNLTLLSGGRNQFRFSLS
jgi:DNA invertase Pin-like site-specific DNA recombinase